MGRDKQTFSIEFLFPTHSADAEDMPVLVMFDIKQEFAGTMEEFKKKARNRWTQLTPELVERVIAAMSGDEYCRKLLQYYEVDAEDSSDEAPDIGEDSKSKYDSNPDEQVEVYASSDSDPDYDDEGLPSFSVTNALRKDHMRMRVHGVIDSIGNLFKLPTKVFFSCDNQKCPACGKRELKVLDRPIFQESDIESIGFKGDYNEYKKNAKCPRCNEMRVCVPNWRGFANVKIIELKNTSSDKVSVLTANPELANESLTTVVFNKHTLTVGLGEDVDIVGQKYVVEYGLAASRYGTGRRANRIARGGSSFKSDSVFYEERMKYTNKKQYIELTATDREMLRRLAANTKSRVGATGRQKGCDLISVIKNLVAPQIYDKSEDNIAKLMLFLTALGAAPNHEKQNFYGERYWGNMGLVGDKGEGKTSLMEEGVNLRPGSQIVVAQHATGKSAVAVVEYDSLSGGARLRVGPVALANGRNCGIDEFQLFDYEDQDQFQTGMQSGRIPFAKAGIRQLIRTHTNFIITANPVGGSWKNKEQISLGEVLIKETLWDRLDFFVIFKSDTTTCTTYMYFKDSAGDKEREGVK